LKFDESQEYNPHDAMDDNDNAKDSVDETAADEFTFKPRKRFLKLSDMQDKATEQEKNAAKLSPVKPNIAVRSKRRKA
jgi:hypothetical protein